MTAAIEEKLIDKMSPQELRKALKDSKQVVEDLMRSHEELLPGVGHVVCDCGLLNTCRINGDAYLRSYR